jgi:hypothetical protein
MCISWQKNIYIKLHGATIKFHCRVHKTLQVSTLLAKLVQSTNSHAIPFRYNFWRVRKITKSDIYLCHVCPSVRLPLDGFPRKLVFAFFFKSVEKIQVSLKSDKNIGTSHEADRYKFL